jgi:acetylornithine deacetylase
MTERAAELAAAIGDAVDRDQEATVGTLRQSIRIPSVTGEEGEAATFFAAVLRDAGLEVSTEIVDRERVGDAFAYWDQELDLPSRPNVYGAWRVGREGRPLVFNGHFDVVPPGDPAGWSDPAFAAVVRDGRVIGRGAADMKGGLAAAIAAVRALKALGLEPRRDLILQFVMGEETGGLGTIAAVCQGEAPGAAIALEPTGLALAPAQAGILKFTLEVTGRSAHTSVPWSGVSAFDLLVELYTDLRTFSDERNARVRHPLFDAWPNKAPFAFGLVQAGHHGWTLPDRAEARGRFGVLPGESSDAARAAVEQRLAQVAAAHPWLRDHPPVIHWAFGDFPGWETPGADPLIESLRLSIQDAAGSVVERGMPYGSDACHIERLAHVPVAIFGPGDIRDCHIPGESVSIDGVLTAAKALALTAMRWEGDV